MTDDADVVGPGDVITTGVTDYRVLYLKIGRWRAGPTRGAMVVPVGGGYARWIDITWPARRVL